MKGSAIKRGFRIEGARIYDLAPTILYLMGTRVPADMDGRVLQEAMLPSHLQLNPPRYMDPPEGGKAKVPSPGYSEEEATCVEERLRGLGYVE